ncbi:nuclear transport factor 2 family protein [Alteromonas sp. 1_MG-2023]|uniref:nuclear transport factor 2 family protein n=1 Tax=Alteromonas sp. 1_MG-2023 TaxID=3062669 RepID=UPI0026E20B80|nr:nuclear transport factor 2 family protein [Alteromonas sp. 1_MG-2023]MDO6474113.1 nuclear transport factor 2 family protein [Alteromonas sp. 1_MG-2023]
MKFLIAGLLLVSTTAFASYTTDEAEIIALLEKESATWRSGDLEAHASCWNIQPYSRILVSNANGSVMDIPPQVIVAPPPGSAGQGGTFEHTDYRFSVVGDSAWVSHHEVATAADGDKTYSYEIRLLERFDNEWKLVGQSIHIYDYGWDEDLMMPD